MDSKPNQQGFPKRDIEIEGKQYILFIQHGPTTSSPEGTEYGVHRRPAHPPAKPFWSRLCLNETEEQMWDRAEEAARADATQDS